MSADRRANAEFHCAEPNGRRSKPANWIAAAVQARDLAMTGRRRGGLTVGAARTLPVRPCRRWDSGDHLEVQTLA